MTTDRREERVMDLSGKRMRVLAEALRYRIEWCDAELAKPEATEDARAILTEDKQCLSSMLEDLTRGRRSTEPGHV